MRGREGEGENLNEFEFCLKAQNGQANKENREKERRRETDEKQSNLNETPMQTDGHVISLESSSREFKENQDTNYSSLRNKINGSTLYTHSSIFFSSFLSSLYSLSQFSFLSLTLLLSSFSSHSFQLFSRLNHSVQHQTHLKTE